MFRRERSQGPYRVGLQLGDLFGGFWRRRGRAEGGRRGVRLREVNSPETHERWTLWSVSAAGVHVVAERKRGLNASRETACARHVAAREVLERI